MHSQHRYFIGLAVKAVSTCLLLLSLTGCGNKGDLYRVNDAQSAEQNTTHQQDMPKDNDQQP